VYAYLSRGGSRRHGWGARVGVGNGVRGAEGAEAETSRSEALKAPRRDAVNSMDNGMGRVFPSPAD